MENNTQHKTRRGASHPRRRPTHEDLRSLLKKLQKMMDKLGYGPSRERTRGRAARYQAAIASASSQRGLLSVRTHYEHNKVPVFNTYEEYHKIVLQSFESISIVLNIDGKVVFVSQNVSSLLGHRPEDILGMSLLNLVLDEQKDEVTENIILNLPLASTVGSLIKFCCYIRKGNVGQNARDRSCYRAMHHGKDIYEYVKFILYLQDSYDESFAFFGNYGPNSRNICSSASTLLWEQQYYLVGNIYVLQTPDELPEPVTIQTNVIVIDSDDDNTVQHRRLHKRHRRHKMKRHSHAEVVNMEARPESSTDVEIVDVQPATHQKPCELVQVRTSSHSSVSTDISATTNVRAFVRASPSSSSTDISTTTPLSTPTSGQLCVMDPKNMLEPQDIEYEMDPEFLLNDSEEEQDSTEQEEFTEADVKKHLGEAKVSNPKEHVIDEDSTHHDVFTDDDCCVVIEDTEDKTCPKTKELVTDPKQEPAAAPSCPSIQLQAVRPEAVVEPMVRTDFGVHGAEPRRTYQFQRPLLGERFAQLCGPRVMTQVYDLSISRSFHDDPPSYSDIEEEEREREQCEYELAQRIEMLRNLPYERPGQQQGPGPRVYRPREQTVTVIDDVGPRAMNFFGNDNSEHSRNESHRIEENPVDDHAPPLVRHSTRSSQVSALSRQASVPPCQAPAVSRQTSEPSSQVSAPSRQVSAPSRQVSAPSCQASAPPCQAPAVSRQPSAPSMLRQASVLQVSVTSRHRSAMSQNASSDHQRENRPRLLPPRQDHSGSVRAEEDTSPRP